MQPYFRDLQDRFQEIHRDIRKVIAGMPAEALDWAPGTEMNSVNILVVHLTGSERYWVGDVAMGEPSNRNREAEFDTRGLAASHLLDRLDTADRYLAAAFEQLTLADLEVMKPSPRSQKSFSVGWALLHALEHSALHLGHLQIVHQLWFEKKSG